MGFLNTDSMPRLVEKLADGDNIKITGNSKGNRVGTVVKKIVEKAGEVTKAIEQEVVNDSYSFKVGTGDVDVSTDVEDGFGEVGVKGVTYQNLIPNLIDSRWKVGGSAIKDRTDLVNGVKLVITSEGSCVLDLIDISMFKPNTKYTLLVNIDTNFTEIRLSNILSSLVKLENGFNCVTFLTKSDFNEMHTCFRIGYTGSLSTGLYMTIKDLIVLEGDHTNNPNLPSYFEGIVGVGDKSKNLFNYKLHDSIEYNGSYFTITKERWKSNFVEYEVEPNTDYTISIDRYDGALWVAFEVDGVQFNNNNYDKFYKVIRTNETGKMVLRLGANTVDDLGHKFANIQLVKGTVSTPYEPYYDGHKIEILSNSKNLFNVKEFAEKESAYYSLNEKGNLVSLKLDDRSSSFKYPIKVKPNTNYTLSTQGVTSFRVYSTITDIAHSNGYFTHTQLLTKDNVSNVTFSSGKYDSIYIKFVERANYPKEIPNIQLEESLVQTSYESHREDKTQILLDEPLMRLPNGVCDEITRDGKLIRRVGKYVFDGLEAWNKTETLTNTTRYSTGSVLTNKLKARTNAKCYCDIVPNMEGNKDVFHARFSGGTPVSQFMIWIEPSKLTVDSNTGFMNWLKSNPVTVYYELAEPIITELPAPYLRIFKDGHLTFNTLVAPESNHVVQLNKSAQIERSIREVQGLDSRVGQLESFYDDMMLETSHKLNLLTYDFEYTKERNGE